MIAILATATLLAAALCYPAYRLYEWARGRLRLAEDADFWRGEYSSMRDAANRLAVKLQEQNAIISAQRDTVFELRDKLELRRLAFGEGGPLSILTKGGDC